MAKNPPTVRMRRLGAQLRKLREDRGLTLDDAATLLKLSKSALGRMETAQVVVRPRDVEYLLIKYEVSDDDLRDSLLGLAMAGRSKEWSRRYKGVVLSEYSRLEQDSTRIRTFHALVVPGLLQTAAYACHLFSQVELDPPQDVGRSVAHRMARKDVLDRPDPAELFAVIGEGVIRQRLGGVEVMDEQLTYLMEMAERSNVTIQVMPFSATRHHGVDGSFTLLNVEPGDFAVAVVDSLARSSFRDEEAFIKLYTAIFENLRLAALPEAESLALIERELQTLRAE